MQAVQTVRPSGVFAKVNRVRFTQQGNKSIFSVKPIDILKLILLYHSALLWLHLFFRQQIWSL